MEQPASVHSVVGLQAAIQTQVCELLMSLQEKARLPSHQASANKKTRSENLQGKKVWQGVRSALRRPDWRNKRLQVHELV